MSSVILVGVFAETIAGNLARNQIVRLAGGRLSAKITVNLRQPVDCRPVPNGRLCYRDEHGEVLAMLLSAGPEPVRWWVQGRTGITKYHPPLSMQYEESSQMESIQGAFYLGAFLCLGAILGIGRHAQSVNLTL